MLVLLYKKNTLANIFDKRKEGNAMNEPINQARKNCPHCGRSNFKSAIHCTWCGKEIHLRCRNCNRSFELPLTDKFCPKCGIKNPILGQRKIIHIQKRNERMHKIQELTEQFIENILDKNAINL